jgi:selenide, water dikinase
VVSVVAVEPIRLTQFSHGAGCACKLGPTELSDVLDPIRDHPAMRHHDLMVGMHGSDDAGVFRLPGDRALVQTVDFFMPVVDDPFDWGRITAANALSDVYAMGGTVLTALQLLGWPRDQLPFEAASEVMRGGAEKMSEAGCTVVGGHSIDSPEPIYGFAVTGLIDASDVIENAGAMVGDLLLLTKPLGLGIITTALKRGVCPPELAAEAVAIMATLNARAAEAMKRAGAHAATDITGYGLLGHLREMVIASKVGARINTSAVPVLDGVIELCQAGHYPGGSKRNLAAVLPSLDGSVDDLTVQILADAQTSGGLLIAVDAEQAETLSNELGAPVIGEVTDEVGRISLG